MAVVALAARDCLGVRVAELIAGCWLVGAIMQFALVSMFRCLGCGRRFWAGFEATGLGFLRADTARSDASRLVVNGWAYRAAEDIYGSMLDLPAGALHWCFEHDLVIDPRKP
jgi:hypothetical protein